MSRTANVRVEVVNKAGAPEAGMFAKATVEVSLVSSEETPPLLIPATAPLLTGTRAVVYVEVPGQNRPTYEGREIELGHGPEIST